MCFLPMKQESKEGSSRLRIEFTMEVMVNLRSSAVPVHLTERSVAMMMDEWQEWKH